jgi:GAF domain-containing protein/HAMP domain-containing protein
MAIAANGSKSAAERSGRLLRIPLWVKFAAATVLLAASLLSLYGAVSLWSAYKEAERAAFAAEQQKAETLAGRIGGVVADLERQLAWTAQPAWKSADIEQQRADFTRMLQQFPDITELFYIDNKGAEQLKVSRFAPDSIASQTDHASEPRFVETVKERNWFGPVYVRNGSELSTTAGKAHADGGVSVAELDLSFVAEFADAASNDTGDIFVVDKTGRLIAGLGKNPIAGDNDMSGLPQVTAALATGGGATSEAVMGGGAPAFAAFAEVPGAGWRVLAQTSKTAAMAPFYTLLWQSALLAVAGLLVAAAVGISLARRVAAPIKRLQLGAEQLAEGDLAQRVAVRRRDEIGALAERFNTMASRLQQSQKGLEAKFDDSAVGFDIALQQQTMTAEMLRTIGRTDYNLERVLDTLIGSAVRLSEANVGAVWLREGDAFRLAAQLGHTGDWVEAARQAPFMEGSDTHAVAAAAAYSGQIINIDDVSRDLRFMGDYGERPANSDERAALAVPLKHGSLVEAVFSLSRADPIPFTERQVAVTQDFADQALTAIRNVRLVEKVEARDRDLAEALEQQAATSGILHAVAQSPADIRPVLEKIAASAARLCSAPYCHVELFDGQHLHFEAHHGLPPEAMDLIGRSFPAEPASGSLAGQAIARRDAVLVADLQAVPEAAPDELSRLLGIRSAAAVPLLKDGAAIGAMTVADPRPDALPASLRGRRLALLKTLADEAVIALDNARLSDDLRSHMSRLSASLDREAATGGLLQAISRTGFDLDEVLAGIAERVARACAADEAQIFRLDGDVLRHAPGGATTESHTNLASRVIAKAAAIAMLDAWQDPDHVGKDTANRSMLGLPLLAKGEIVGAMTLARGQVLPFDEKQSELAAGLADQAALAVAGAQLPEQLAERTAERDEARHRHATDVEAARRQHAAEMDETRRVHAAELDETRRLHTAEVDEAKGRHETEIAELRRLHAEVLDERTAERDESRQRHAADVGAAERQRVAETEELRRQHAEEVDETRQRHEVELGELRGLHAAALEETLARHGAELDETRRLHASELGEARRRHATELAEARHLHATELGEARRLHAADRDTARLQRTAIAEALKRIADPSAGLDSVLEKIVGLAARACGASASVLFRQAGDQMEPAAVSGLPEENREATLAAIRDALAAKVIAQAETLHVTAAGEAAFRTALGVPLLQNDTAQGALVLLSAETEPFSQELAGLAESFADQAVVAIETERLSSLAALRAGQLDEALRFRVATARTLDLVGGVETDPQPALDAIVATAAELCRAEAAELRLAEGGAPRLVAARGAAGGDGSAAQLAAAKGRVIHTVSDAADGAMPGMVLAVPLISDGKAAGALALRRETANSFSEREIELAGTLAAQAAIAIAAARLAGALEERSQSLDRASSERQATARMLARIGRSRFDLGAVLDTLARSAAELCDAGMAAICLDNDDVLESAGSVGLPQGWLGDPRHLQAGSLARRALREATALQSSGDVAAGSTLAVPLLGEDGAIGALVIMRPAPFDDMDIAAAAMLADQAAISVGKLRLLDTVEARTAELGEAMRHQAATADVLRSVNDAAFDLTGVLAAVAGHAARLCGAATARLYFSDGDALRFVAGAGITAEQHACEEASPLRMDANSEVGRAAIEKATAHAPDIAGDTADRERFGNAAAMLCAPVLHQGAVIGVFALTRSEPGPFSERQIELVETLANQAAIVIENVRLLDGMQARTAELGEVLRQQTATADVLTTISRSTFDLDAVLTTLTASAAALCHAGGSAVFMLKDGAYRLVAATGAMPAPLVSAHLPGQDNWVGRAALDKVVIHVADTARDGEHPEIAGINGLAAILCVPLLREGAVTGVFALTRSEPKPFTERQIGLASTFADEAAIAIESAERAGEAQERAREFAALLKDLRTARARLGQTERLASLGQLTAGIAREIEERLNAVNDVSKLSNRLVDDIRMVLEAAVIDGGTRAEVEELGDTLKDNLDKVVWHGKRADSVVRNMLLNVDEGAGKGSGGRCPVDINSMVDESLGLAYHGARAEREDFDITLEKKFDPQAGTVDLYPREITRALLNLISNGFYATARRGAEVNGTAYRPVLAASTRNLGNAVEIRIRDNGTGIAPEVKAEMFKPFFTTKPDGEGTGLGLSLSHDIIVTQHSGTIDVETVPGSFTEFRIVLPRSGVATAKPEA